ncbi:ABC transporter ATP-binding protein [Paenarthrobacter sp. PH39-S1]|uniref:ABC transporter ATP-binding protein n=1 Tax=Paenarthrobacter sp. PH39-S1 TaxID=3046204 RepID=UPI0024BAF34A|nr:ABC transporter ATP-binding protein [Paenarthrobacter sp. PH39-S1]MDJ0356785.1 ABC transporter ATP-binding protein [Paenarthrobacter sp. PH39-S1]
MTGGGRGGRLLSGPGDLNAPTIRHLGRRIWALLRNYRGKLAGTAVLVLVGSSLGVAVPLLTQRAFDDALFPHDGGVRLALLAQLVGLMIALSIAASVLNVLRTYLTTSVGNKVMADLRSQLFSHLQKMELAFFTRTKTGVIQSRLANDVGGVASVLTNTVPSILANTVTVISSLAAMLLLSWQLTVVALILLPFLVLLQIRIGRVRQVIARRTQESLSDMTSITQEALSVSGIVLSKVFNQEAAETARYRAENDKQLKLQIKQQMTGQWFFGSVQIVMSITPAIVYLSAGWLLTQSWPITAGTLVAFTTLQARISMPILSLMRVSLDVQTSQALFARIFEYLDLRPGITDRRGAVTLPAGTIRGGLALDGVSFSYSPSPVTGEVTWALENVSLTIGAGEFAAFVGASGAGKTTLSYLIPRLYEATRGRILLDGTDIQNLTMESLRQNIGMVTQETYLFHSTIAENLRYARPSATDAELVRAAKVANIHDRIMSFEAGYQTVVGERGYRLSGGEKQRLAIARVVLKNPPLLILDEATSALDTTGERLVQGALEAVMADRTTIAIAHRLSTVISADRIFVLDRGQLAEQGTHEQLLADGGIYARLNLAQLRSAEDLAG